jgi:hypothetical protein
VGGSFAPTAGKRPSTKDDDDWGNKLAPMGEWRKDKQDCG